jgi:hypothetical protein
MFGLPVLQRWMRRRTMLKRTMLKQGLLLWLCLLPLACQRQSTAPPPAHAEVVTMGNHGGERGGERRQNRHEDRGAGDPAAHAAPPPADYLAGTHWPLVQLREGEAWIGCGNDAADGGTQIDSLDFLALVDALSRCRDTAGARAGSMRLRYRGNIGAGFTALVERVGTLAQRMGIGERILDLDSTGGQVEEAIRAGDAIAGAQWAIRVRAGSICHSACVLVLAAGDTRSIAGKVGIHRLIRDRSTATTRRELNAELRDVTEQVRDYLARNGVAGALADQMMTIPNRELRLLTTAELAQYGLSGTNAVQDDLDRITLMRQCGDDFVRRRDAFLRAFDGDCMKSGPTPDAQRECGLALEQRFGFPDPKCAGQSPMDDDTRRAAALLQEPSRTHRSRATTATD